MNIIKVLFSNKNCDLKKIDEQINTKLNGIEEKLKDMNILDMFKGLSGDDGDNTNVIKLVNNLTSVHIIIFFTSSHKH